MRALLLFVLLVPLTATAAGPYAESWSWPEKVADVDLAPAGNCAAVAKQDAVLVVNPAGKVLWQWRFGNAGKFLVADHIAVAPNCEFVAFVGKDSYRYAWIVHRDGHRVSFAMQYTPVAVAISPDGMLVAFGTSARQIWLFDNNGKERWRKQIDGTCCIWRLEFSADSQSIFSTGGDALAAVSTDGEVRWTNSNGTMWAARDGKTFVAFSEPPHGCGFPTFTVIDETGKELWSRLGSPGIASPQGDAIAAAVNNDQEPDEPLCGDAPATLKLMSRSGEVIAALPGEGTPLAFSPDGHLIVIRRTLQNPDMTWTNMLEAVDRSGASRWQLPIGRDSRKVRMTEDLKVILVQSYGKVTWYSAR